MAGLSLLFRSVILVLAFFCVVPTALKAQQQQQQQQQQAAAVQFPQASQHAVVKQRVGLTDIEVDYSRPNKNKREIFGGLVPWDKVWRTGANAATKIRFSDAVTIGDKQVAAGQYALFTIPKQNEWTIILSKNLELPYKPESDVARITANPLNVAEELETFTIGFNDLRADNATMFLAWDRTVVPVKLKTNDVAKVIQQIDAAIKQGKELDANFYNSAAGFYLDQNKNLKQAAEWIDKAIAKNPDAYFMYSRKAQIEAKLGNKSEAITAAEKSNQILESRPDRDESAIRNNRLLIESLR
jgi:tetratricopeptide (TPR) repeat protein